MIMLSTEQNKKRKIPAMLITYHSGHIVCIEKTPSSMEMVICEFDLIEEVIFIDMFVYETGANQ